MIKKNLHKFKIHEVSERLLDILTEVRDKQWNEAQYELKTLLNDKVARDWKFCHAFPQFAYRFFCAIQNEDKDEFEKCWSDFSKLSCQISEICVLYRLFQPKPFLGFF